MGMVQCEVQVSGCGGDVLFLLEQKPESPSAFNKNNTDKVRLRQL